MELFGDPLYRPWSNPVPRQKALAQTLLHNRPFPVSPAQETFPNSSTTQDRSTFPGKYVPFDSKVLSL